MFDVQVLYLVHPMHLPQTRSATPSIAAQLTVSCLQATPATTRLLDFNSPITYLAAFEVQLLGSCQDITPRHPSFSPAPSLSEVFAPLQVINPPN